jgi:hypothetical protein
LVVVSMVNFPAESLTWPKLWLNACVRNGKPSMDTSMWPSEVLA